MSNNNNVSVKPNAVISRQESSFSGSIPPPQFLKEYNEIVPGAAEIIIKMAKEQAEHRQSLEKSVINSDIKNSRMGLVLGFIIGMMGIIMGAILIILGHVWAGAAMSGATLVSLVGTFVYGSQGRKKEREEKNK